MLLNLHIVNMALIDEIDIDFTDGLNVLTGETGAGKSIIVGSIGIGLGGKFDTGLLRKPDQDGIVELLFSVNDETIKKFEELGISGTEDGEILISRRLTNGRVINRINNNTVTIGRLKQASQYLINLHAQHEQQTLMKASKHLEILDEYGKEKIADIKRETSIAYKAWHDTYEKLKILLENGKDRSKKLDYLGYEIEEIENANLKKGEDEEIESLYKKQTNSGMIAEITGHAYEITGYENNVSAGNQISQVVHDMQNLQKIDESKEAEQLYRQIMDIDSMMNDFNRMISDYESGMEFDPEDLDMTEMRLNQLNTLKMKYGSTIDEILDNLEGFKKEQSELVSYDETVENLKKNEIEEKEKLKEKSDELTRARKEVSKHLVREITESLEKLNFNQAKFDMNIEKTDSYTSNGNDNAIFMISTNIGEPEKPLTDVVSGGELSRIMLAIKSTLSETGDTPTLVFDEIDVGISGITARKVGEMMKKLSKTHQIISITHLAQIAAFADTSFVIEKTVSGNKTNTGIRKLDQEGRVNELARLLGGDKVTDAVMTAAREMLGIY